MKWCKKWCSLILILRTVLKYKRFQLKRTKRKKPTIRTNRILKIFREHLKTKEHFRCIRLPQVIIRSQVFRVREIQTNLLNQELNQLLKKKGHSQNLKTILTRLWRMKLLQSKIRFWQSKSLKLTDLNMTSSKVMLKTIMFSCLIFENWKN